MLNNMVNLHFATDEKVITRAIQYFEEALPAQNKVIIIIPYENYECKHVKVKADNIIYATYKSKKFYRAVGDIIQYKNVIYHYLTNELVDFTLKINYSNLTWVIWGGDLYNNLLIHKGFKLYEYPNDIYKGYKEFFLFWRDKLRSLWYLNRREKAIAKITNVACVECDKLLLNKYFPTIKFNYKNFFYYPVEDMLGTLVKSECIGNNIFVGNSASYTNNHRKIFERLSEYGHKLGNRKVFVPLSYGGAKELVVRYGKKLLGEKFIPLKEFIPIEEYNKLMLSANLFIYGNYRQEAWGNIAVALYLGAVVVLEPRNPFYKNLSDEGFVLFSTENLNELLNYRLSVDEKKRNRDLINKLYSKERLLNLIKTSFG